MICTFLGGRMKKAIWLLAFSLLVMPLLIQFFEVDCFRASASEDAVPIEFGETLSGSIDVAGETDAYTFSGNASDLVLIRVSGGLVSYPGIRLYSPNGTKLKGASGLTSAELSYTLPDDWEYKILVSVKGSYKLSLKSMTIWSSDSMGNKKNTFASTETVYVTVPATGENVTFYIVAGQDVWNDGDPLTDVSDGAEQLTLDPGPGIQVVQVWGPPLTLGSYDIVIDTNNNGLYDAGVDWIDSMAEVGFVVEYTPVNNPPYQPQLSIAPSLAIEDNDDLIVTVIGPTPADPDGDAVTYTYRWLVDVGTKEFLDDEIAGRGDHTGNTVPAADTVAGDIWRVEVTPVDEHDAVGPNAIATWQVVVDATKPVADAGLDQTVVEDVVVSFDAGSSSGNMGIVSYEWNFGDGITGTGITITHTYTEPGIYTVTLTVKDAAGNSDTDGIIITVQTDTDEVVVEEIIDPELVNATNPFIVNATEEAATLLIISEISDPITIVVRNITEPEGVDPPPGTLKVLGTYVQITVNNTDITVNATIRIYYTLEQLEASGLDENTLETYFWNATSGEWEPVESHVNTEEHYVWAIIDHFSFFAILGEPGEGGAPLPTQLWLLAIVSIVIITVSVVSVIYIRRRKTAITDSNQKP